MKLQSEQDTINKKVKQKIFNEETVFDYSDFYDLRSNKSYDRFFSGNLKLSTGQVVCTDPMFRALGLPQSWTTNPGDYPVCLYIGLDEDFGGRVAYAELSLKDEIPVYWELSLIPDQLLADDFEKKMNGLYPVENGLGSFSDYETWKLYNQEIDDFYMNKDGNYYNSILDAISRQTQIFPQVQEEKIGLITNRQRHRGISSCLVQAGVMVYIQDMWVITKAERSLS